MLNAVLNPEDGHRSIRQPEIRILAITKSTGGIAFYNKLLLSELQGQGFASHTICLSDNAEAYAADLKQAGLSAEPYGMARYRIDPRGDIKVLRHIRDTARAFRADVILCHGSKPGYLGRAAGYLSGLPVAYRQASMPFMQRIQGRKAPVYWVLEFLARSFKGHVVTLTKGAWEQTIKYKLISPTRSSVIRTGIDTDHFLPYGIRSEVVREFGLDPARPVVGWIGRLEMQKAPLDFFDAVELVAARHPEAQFVMAGDGSLKQPLEARIAASGFKDRVRLLPWQSDPARTLQGFDLYALSSLWEGLPITLLEAMACGCVPVSTDVDGCDEVIEQDVSGVLISPSQPERMADELSNLLGAPDRMTQMAVAARSRIQDHFEKSQMVVAWTALLSSLAQRTQRGQSKGRGNGQ